VEVSDGLGSAIRRSCFPIGAQSPRRALNKPGLEARFGFGLFSPVEICHQRFVIRRDWNLVEVEFGGRGSVMVRRGCHSGKKSGHAALSKVPVPSDNKSPVKMFRPRGPLQKLTSCDGEWLLLVRRWCMDSGLETALVSASIAAAVSLSVAVIGLIPRNCGDIIRPPR
jgi:hypothetical protein